MDPLWHARNPSFNSLASAQRYTFLTAYPPESLTLPSRQANDHSSRNRKIVDIQVYKRGWVFEVANKCGGCPKKKRGKWRVYVDYTNLNDVCPKNSFPLSRIDQIVDSTTGHEMLSFIDVFSGYHQIPMFQPNEEKTSFVTPHRLYCYKVMPFGLKNTGATYQRLMTKNFKPLIG